MGYLSFEEELVQVLALAFGSYPFESRVAWSVSHLALALSSGRFFFPSDMIGHKPMVWIIVVMHHREDVDDIVAADYDLEQQTYQQSWREEVQLYGLKLFLEVFTEVLS